MVATRALPTSYAGYARSDGARRDPPFQIPSRCHNALLPNAPRAGDDYPPAAAPFYSTTLFPPSWGATPPCAYQLSANASPRISYVLSMLGIAGLPNPQGTCGFDRPARTRQYLPSIARG